MVWRFPAEHSGAVVHSVADEIRNLNTIRMRNQPNHNLLERDDLSDIALAISNGFLVKASSLGVMTNGIVELIESARALWDEHLIVEYPYHFPECADSTDTTPCFTERYTAKALKAARWVSHSEMAMHQHRQNGSISTRTHPEAAAAYFLSFDPYRIDPAVITPAQVIAARAINLAFQWLDNALKIDEEFLSGFQARYGSRALDRLEKVDPETFVSLFDLRAPSSLEELAEAERVALLLWSRSREDSYFDALDSFYREQRVAAQLLDLAVDAAEIVRLQSIAATLAGVPYFTPEISITGLADELRSSLIEEAKKAQAAARDTLQAEMRLAELKEKKAEIARQNGKESSGPERKVDPDRVKAVFESLCKTTRRREISGILAERFNCTRQHINRILKGKRT